MDVFSALPNAIVHNVWVLGAMVRNTETGRAFIGDGYKDVIVDEEVTGLTDRSPSADGITTDTLLYARPEQMPTKNCVDYIDSYLWFNEATRQYYKIVKVGVGKNQETGLVEHYEFWIQPTDVAEGVDG